MGPLFQRICGVSSCSYSSIFRASFKGSSLRGGTIMSSNITDLRPLSPHVQIYRWRITMAMSIAHRLTGAALYFGTLFLCIWLVGLAFFPKWFLLYSALLHAWLGKTVLFLYSFALIHHGLGGVRHLLWDVKPCLLEKKCASLAAWANLVFSILLTVAIWAGAFFGMRGS